MQSNFDVIENDKIYIRYVSQKRTLGANTTSKV